LHLRRIGKKLEQNLSFQLKSVTHYLAKVQCSTLLYSNVKKSKAVQNQCIFVDSWKPLQTAPNFTRFLRLQWPQTALFYIKFKHFFTLPYGAPFSGPQLLKTLDPSSMSWPDNSIETSSRTQRKDTNYYRQCVDCVLQFVLQNVVHQLMSL